MEFEINLASVCRGIGAYNKMIQEVSVVTKDVAKVTETLTTNNWTGKSSEQYKLDMDVWQSQMGKFLEDAYLVNKVLADTVNADTVDMQKLCNGLVDYLE